MPWSSFDNFAIRKALLLPPLYTTSVQASMDAITAEAEIEAMQAILVEIKSLDEQLATTVASDAIEELVGDIKFREGGQTKALERRRGVLVSMLRTLILGQESGYQTNTPYYRV